MVMARTQAADKELSDKLAMAERESRARPVDARELMAMVEGIVATMEGDLSPMSIKVYAELEQLANFIQKAKSEIAQLRPDEIRDEHLPTATDELEAIVGATEGATNGILNAVEQIENLTGEMPPAIAEKVSEAVTQVYESCNFQDITGQRISKVVKALQHIESKVAGLLSAFGDEITKHRNDGAPQDAPADASKQGAPSDQALLNGPQLPQEAKGQADIDALFASLG
jgi:chemotaxis protein CheZ